MQRWGGHVAESFSVGDAEVTRLRVALMLIAGNSCESSTVGPGSCWKDGGRSPAAEYTADKWCDRCIARAALRPGPENEALMNITIGRLTEIVNG
jgi:hypothetical protein